MTDSLVTKQSFSSRRSVVYGSNGAIATSQPLAARVGLRILEDGGNAVDAAVAAMASLGVLEPMSTGFGGDAFALVSTPQGSVKSINGSGPAGSLCRAEDLRNQGFRRMPAGDPEDGPVGMSVTVPGAVRTWNELLESHGTITLDSALEPAQRLAEGGFPVSEVAAWMWRKYRDRLISHPAGHELLVGDVAPSVGELVRLPTLGASLETIRNEGADALYVGSIAERIIETIDELGGAVTPEDLATFKPEWVYPIDETYGSYRVYQCPPNGQGVVSLLALRALDERLAGNAKHPGHRAGTVVFELSRALGIAGQFVADPRFGAPTYEEIRNTASSEGTRVPTRDRSGDTAYVAVIDGDGMACSLISSLYEGFGTGVVVPGTGIALQNRGALFSLEEGHPNELQPGKRPYHTIMPSIVTRDDGWLSAFGVVGGYRQPQAQVQILLNIADLGMDPQSAIDQPRFGIDVESDELILEPGFSASEIDELRDSGWRIRYVEGYDRGFVGGAQMVCRHPSGVFAGASDPRKDGIALAF